MTPSSVVCILGMHRSGTSCLTGTLQEAGLHLGEVFTANPHNAKGNRENARIMNLHEALLTANGGSWRNPPARVAWDAVQCNERDAIVASYPRVRWGFKDPRTLLALDGWQEALPDLDYVGVFRHPTAVAASLQRRSGMPLHEGIALWARYNELLLEYWRSHRFPLVSFDLPESALESRLRGLLATLKLDAPVKLTFFDRGLRHQRPIEDYVLPPRAAALYAALQEASRGAGTAHGVCLPREAAA